MQARPRWPLAVTLGLALLAGLAIRLYLYADVPGYTDETLEILRGWRIAQGQQLPLTNEAAYIGPLWNYVLAAVFLIFGANPDLPRLAMVAIGTACVALSGALAWRHGGPLAGLVATALIATCGMQVLLGSRIGWSVCVAPLPFALSLLFLHRALERGSGRWLALGGLVYGVAVQCHLVAATAAPGLIFAVLLHPNGRRLLRTPWAVLAVVAVFAPQIPVIAQALSPHASEGDLPGHFNEIVRNDRRLASVALRLPDLVVQLLRVVSSELEGGDRLSDFLLRPRFDVFGLWVALGLLLAALRRHWLLVLPVVSYCSLWPFVNFSYELFFESRYTIFLLAPLFASMALFVTWIVERIELRALAPARRPILALAGLVLLGLIVWPLFELWTYTERQVASGKSNKEERDAVALVEAPDRRDTLLVVDDGLKKPGLDGGGTIARTLEYFRSIEGGPFQAVDLNSPDEQSALRVQGPKRFMLAARAREARDLESSYDLLELRRYSGDASLTFSLYQATRRQPD